MSQQTDSLERKTTQGIFNGLAEAFYGSDTLARTRRATKRANRLRILVEVAAWLALASAVAAVVLALIWFAGVTA